MLKGKAKADLAFVWTAEMVEGMLINKLKNSRSESGTSTVLQEVDS